MSIARKQSENPETHESRIKASGLEDVVLWCIGVRVLQDINWSALGCTILASRRRREEKCFGHDRMRRIIRRLHRVHCAIAA